MGTTTDLQTLNWGLTSPEQKGQALIQTLREFDPLRKGISLPPGIYNTGDIPLVFPSIIVESDKDTGGTKTNVVLKNSARWGYPQGFTEGKVNNPYGSCFVLSDRTELKNITLESTVDPNRQSTVCGFGIDTTPSVPRRCFLTNCFIKGGAWGVYSWYNWGDTFTITGCDIYAGNICVMLGKSVKDGQNFYISDSRLTIQPGLTTQGGSTTNPMDGGSIGICIRGGNVYIRNVLINLQGQDVGRGPNMCAIQDHLDREGESTEFLNIYCYEMNTMFNPFPGRKLEDYYTRDIDCQYGNVYMGGQCSSMSLAPNRQLRVARKDRKPIWPS